jgi:hypothetical protein
MDSIEKQWDYALEYEDVIYFITADANLDQEPETIRNLIGIEKIQLKFSCWEEGFLKKHYENQSHFNNKRIEWIA